MLYLDNAATTKLNPEVLTAMLDSLNSYGNSEAKFYEQAEYAKKAISIARSQVAHIINAKNDDEIISIIGCTDEDTICVTTKCGNRFFACDTIPTKPRKSAPVKLMSVPVNDEITDVRLADPSEIQ